MWSRKPVGEPIDAVKADVAKVWEHLASMSARITSLSQDTKAAPSSELLERIESLERRFASLHSLLTEKSPATGAERLSKTGKHFRAIYQNRP